VFIRVILADPPWQHNDRKAVRKDNPEQKTRLGMGAAGNYGRGTMPTADIAALGPWVQAVCMPDAYLFLWVLESMPHDHLQVLEAWGFEQVCTAFSWTKTNRVAGTPFFGPGKYTAGNLERCILARRNRKKFCCWHSTAEGAWKPAQAIVEPHECDENNRKIHSRKPAEVHQRIERWLGPYLEGCGMLEMFATQDRPGWVCLGDSVTGRDIKDDLADLAERMLQR